jgi:hypothetical protein
VLERQRSVPVDDGNHEHHLCAARESKARVRSAPALIPTRSTKGTDNAEGERTGQRSNSVPRSGRYQAALDLFSGRNTAAIELNEAAARQLEMLTRELR